MPDHCRQRPRSCRSVRLARTRTANLVVHRPIHRFVPTPTTVLRAKAIASTAPARPPSDQRRGQFPIALAAPSVPYPPQFRALALFGRRPPERVVGIVGAGIRKPAQEETFEPRHLRPAKTKLLGLGARRLNDRPLSAFTICSQSRARQPCLGLLRLRNAVQLIDEKLGDWIRRAVFQRDDLHRLVI